MTDWKGSNSQISFFILTLMLRLYMWTPGKDARWGRGGGGLMAGGLSETNYLFSCSHPFFPLQPAPPGDILRQSRDYFSICGGHSLLLLLPWCLQYISHRDWNTIKIVVLNNPGCLSLQDLIRPKVSHFINSKYNDVFRLTSFGIGTHILHIWFALLPKLWK